jgi:type VI secretion system protein ImpD
MSEMSVTVPVRMRADGARIDEAAGCSRAISSVLDLLLADPSVAGVLRLWGEAAAADGDPRDLAIAVNRHVALIDELINGQVNAILHHPTFQRLEATWRGLAFLTRRRNREGGGAIKVRIMDVSWAELGRDLDGAIDFDQSELFRKIYESEFGSPGGEPFGALIGDYEIHPRPGYGTAYDDLDVLRSIAGVAAAAFCPFLANASPAMFGLSDSASATAEAPASFIKLQQTLDHAHYLKASEKWQSLRDHEDGRFIGLALPRVLMRLPYGPDSLRRDGFVFAEDVDGLDQRKFLWGGAAFALGAVILRAFENAGWPANIRGVEQGVDGGGLVSGLPVDEPGTDSPGVAQKYTTDVVITDRLEKELAELGFIPLCHCADQPYAAFYSVPSIQKPQAMDRPAANANARLSAMIPYMLCVSRFAHYIKVMGRDRVGAVTSTDQLERILQDWLTRYVVLDDNASAETKARNPLREARIQITSKPGAPGAYRCVIHLVPHYELDDMAVKVRLTTEISSPRIR